MSKCYVIKNKDGEYLSNKPYIFTKQLPKARLYINNTNVDKEIYRFKGCEVVEVTIAEGNLEEEIRVLKKALELAVKQLYPEPFFKFKKEYMEDFIQQAKEGEDGN